MRVVVAGLALFGFALGCVAAQATTHATTSASPSHAQTTHSTKPATSFVFCKTTATPQYYSAVFESGTWNHASDFQSFVAKQYNRGNQAALCYPRATKEQAQKYMDQLVASARANVPEDAPKREVVVLTKWSPPATPPKPATTAASATPTASAASAAPAATSGTTTPTGATAAQAQHPQ